MSHSNIYEIYSIFSLEQISNLIKVTQSRLHGYFLIVVYSLDEIKKKVEKNISITREYLGKILI